MGQEACRAVEEDSRLELVAVIGRDWWSAPPSGRRHDQHDLASMATAASPDVLVDFAPPASVMQHATLCAAQGVHMVIGTSGFSEADISELERLFGSGPVAGDGSPAGESAGGSRAAGSRAAGDCTAGGGSADGDRPVAREHPPAANCVLAPNFAIGAVLASHLAAVAAPFADTVEIVEMHHDAKTDAPSGTSVATAREIAAARVRSGQGPFGGDPTTSHVLPCARGAQSEQGVRVHSVRMRGAVAHQEVVLGMTGQTLTIRHDSYDRASFMPGLLMAVKSVPSRRGFTVGLGALLGL